MPLKTLSSVQFFQHYLLILNKYSRLLSLASAWALPADEEHPRNPEDQRQQLGQQIISEQFCPWTGAGWDCRYLTGSASAWAVDFLTSLVFTPRPNALFCVSLLSAAEQEETNPYFTSFSHVKTENVESITWNLPIPPLQRVLPFSIAICLLPPAFPSLLLPLFFFEENIHTRAQVSWSCVWIHFDWHKPFSHWIYFKF